MSRHPSGRHRRAEAVAPDPIARASRQGRLAPLAPLAPLALLTWLALALAMSGAIATTRAPLRAQAQPWVLMGHDNLRSEILRLDTRTGAASVVGATGWSSRGSGMDMAPARLETVTGRLEAGALMGLIFDTAISADYLSRVDLPSGMAEKRTLVQGVLPQRGLAFGGAEPKLYVVDHDRTLRVLDPLSGRLALVGPLRDDAGRAYLGDNLTWEPRADRLISLLADDRFAYETLALIDPASARVQPLTTFVDRFSVCSLARNPVAVPGPGGRDFAAGSLFFVDGRSAHLMAIELDPVAGRVDGLVDIGPVGPELGLGLRIGLRQPRPARPDADTGTDGDRDGDPHRDADRDGHPRCDADPEPSERHPQRPDDADRDRLGHARWRDRPLRLPPGPGARPGGRDPRRDGQPGELQGLAGAAQPKPATGAGEPPASLPEHGASQPRLPSVVEQARMARRLSLSRSNATGPGLAGLPQAPARPCQRQAAAWAILSRRAADLPGASAPKAGSQAPRREPFPDAPRRREGLCPDPRAMAVALASDARPSR